MAESEFGKLTVVSVEDLPDGQCKIVFDVDDAFKRNFKQMYGLKRFSRKKFNEFVIEALKRGIGKDLTTAEDELK
jgi:hypothetical protein